MRNAGGFPEVAEGFGIPHRSRTSQNWLFPYIGDPFCGCPEVEEEAYYFGGLDCGPGLFGSHQLPYAFRTLYYAMATAQDSRLLGPKFIRDQLLELLDTWTPWVQKPSRFL